MNALFLLKLKEKVTFSQTEDPAVNIKNVINILLESINRSLGDMSDDDNCSLTLFMSLGCK